MYFKLYFKHLVSTDSDGHPYEYLPALKYVLCRVNININALT